MKLKYLSAFFFATACLLAQPVVLQAQTTDYDDIYFDGVEEEVSYSQNKKEKAVNSSPVEDEVYDDEIAESEVVRRGYMEEDYVVGDNYEPYDYEYSSRIRRFHNSAPGFSYYSDYYTDNYWYDPFNSYGYGTSIYIVPNYVHYGWSSNFGWGYHYNPYNPWRHRWGWSGGVFYGYNSWGNSWGNNWGYNNGWCDGYQAGVWAANNNYYNGGYGYNYAVSTPNATRYVPVRGRRGSDVVSAGGAHTSTRPGGRRLTTTGANAPVGSGRSVATGRDGSIRGNKVNTAPTRPNSVNGTRVPDRSAGTTSTYTNRTGETIRTTTTPTRTTIVRTRPSGRTTPNGSNTAPSRGTYTPSRGSASPSRGGYPHNPATYDPKGSTTTPSRGGYTRSGSSTSPSRGGYTPSRSTTSPSSRTPSRSTTTPSRSYTPSRSTTTPSRSYNTPSRSTTSPSRSYTPSRSSGSSSSNKSRSTTPSRSRGGRR